MKLKQHPDDFRVEELTDVNGGETGTHALYRLDKTGWTTHDALAAVRRRWKIEVRRVAFGGLKDRHAHTIQYFTILHGPRRNLTHQTIRVEYLGQVTSPYTSADIRGNRFDIVLRALDNQEIETAADALREVQEHGVPNYFDDQRFGSVSDGEFVARLMLLERYEDALRTALAAPYEFDRGARKREKTILRDHWGDWETCRARLQRGDGQRIVSYLLDHPNDFRGAVAILPADLRGLYLAAYQSHLWNRMLARWIEARLPADQLGTVRLRMGDLPIHRVLTNAQREEFAATTLPLPSARVRLEPTDDRLALIKSVLEEDGLILEDMQFKGRREMFFSKGERAVLCTPANLRHEVVNDERNAGHLRLALSFDLPRGSYATLIVKRITACRFSIPSA